MKDDKTILEEAKAMTTDKYGFANWYHIPEAQDDLVFFSLKIKGEEMEKEIDDFKRAIKENRDVTISNLKAELSQAREEKAKAFDEGELSMICSAMNSYWYEAKIKLDRKDLGDIDRQQYQIQLDRAKEFLMKHDR